MKKGCYVKLIQETYQNNPFDEWKKHLNDTDEMLIAAIPFVRNIAEYIGQNDNFLKLTSLLHFKENTTKIKISDLEIIIKAILTDKSTLVLPNGNNLVIDVIYKTADKVLSSTSEIIELENKIVLAIGTRLKAEEFVVKKIGDETFWKGIQKNQTYELITRFKKDYPKEYDNISLLEQVNLMTPENIHLNSFMYEPILDMSNEHLKSLYKQVRDNLK